MGNILSSMATKSEPIEVPCLQGTDLPPYEEDNPYQSLPSNQIRNRSEKWAVAMSRVEAIHSCATDPRDMLLPTPWAAHQRANHETSRLYQIPKEILEHISESADHPTRLMLRQSCSLLLHVISRLDNKRLAQAHSPVWERGVADHFGGCLYFPIHGPVHAFLDSRSDIVPLLRRDLIPRLLQQQDRICRSCRDHLQSPLFEARIYNLLQPLYCGFCRKEHPTILFSDTQRRQDAARRICIKHAWSLQLCSHQTLSWGDLQGGIRRSLTSYCGWTQYCSEAAAHEPEYPEYATGLRMPHIEFARHRAVFVWYAPAFDLDASVPVTRQHLRAFIDAPSWSPNAVFCPHVAPNDERLLVPFRRDQCACFDRRDEADLQPVDPATAVATLAQSCHWHSENGQTTDCCRCKAVRDPTRKGTFLPEDFHAVSGVWPVQWMKRRADPQPTQKPGPMLDMLDRGVPGGDHEYTCPQCSAKYAWVRWKDRRVYLRCSRVVYENRTNHWLRCLPSSLWASTQDEETHRITWCEDPSCRIGETWTKFL